MVALVAKRREMGATIMLGLVRCALIGTALPWVAKRWSTDEVIAWMLWDCADLFAIVVGGAIVQMRRSAGTTLPSHA